MPKRYRAKTEVEAAKVTVSNMTRVEDWCKGSIKGTSLPPEERVIEVQTLAGEMTAEIGDYIVKFPQGEFYILTEDTFNSLYERI